MCLCQIESDGDQRSDVHLRESLFAGFLPRGRVHDWYELRSRRCSMSRDVRSDMALLIAFGVFEVALDPIVPVLNNAWRLFDENPSLAWRSPAPASRMQPDRLPPWSNVGRRSSTEARVPGRQRETWTLLRVPPPAGSPHSSTLNEIKRR